MVRGNPISLPASKQMSSVGLLCTPHSPAGTEALLGWLRVLKLISLFSKFFREPFKVEYFVMEDLSDHSPGQDNSDFEKEEENKC